MSLIRQLWLLLAGVLVLAVGGAAAIGLWSTHALLQAQLATRNADAAQALALVLSQQQGDAARLELALTAQFDTGSYRRIRLLAPDGRPLVERSAPVPATSGLGDWLRIEAPPGVAQVSDGWRALGRVEVESQVGDAHEALGRSVRHHLALLAVLGSVAAVLAWVGVRRIRRPLQATVEQARSLVDGRYVLVDKVPAAPELRELHGAMNMLVQRVRSLFEAQAAQVDQLRREAHCDPLTGLLQRSYFMQRLAALLQREDGVDGGGLVLVRLADVAGLNRDLGRAVTDEALLAITQVLQVYPERVTDCFVGRLNGADFGLCLPASGMAAETAASISAALRSSLPACGMAVQAQVGAIELQRGSTAGALMAQADLALARAEAQGPFGVEVMGGGADADGGERTWRSQLLAAIDVPARRRLVQFPVLDRREALLHLECPMRLQLQVDGAFEPAARWLPLAVRHRLTAAIDVQAVTLALEAIAHDGRPRAVNLAPASLADGGFAAHLSERLQDRPQAAEGLWIEVAESAALEHFESLQSLGRLLRPLGVRFGLEHAGPQLHRVERLYELGLDYVKLDASVCAGVAHSDAAQEFIRSTSALLHALSVHVLAEGMVELADVAVLWACGVDAVTGPWASARWEP